MKQVDAVLGVAVHNLVASDMAHVVHQDLLAKEINQGLDGLCHLLWLDGLILVFKEARKVEIGISHAETLDVESVLKENANVVQLLGLAEVFPDLVSENENSLYDLFLIEFVFLLIRIFLKVFAVVAFAHLFEIKRN